MTDFIEAIRHIGERFINGVWRIGSMARFFVLVISNSRVSFARGIGVGPTPSAVTREPQKGWPTVKGTTTAGTPARKAAPVVPAPP